MVLDTLDMNYTALENDDSSLDKCFEEYVEGFHRMGYNVNNLNHNHLINCCVGTYSHNCSIPDGKNVMFNVEFVSLCFDKAFRWFLLYFRNSHCHSIIFVCMVRITNEIINAGDRYFWLIFRWLCPGFVLNFGCLLFVLFGIFWFQIRS